MSLFTRATILAGVAIVVPDNWLDAFARISFEIPPETIVELLWAIVVSASSALIVLVVVRWLRRRRNRNSLVLELADRGLSVAQIARRLELSQDIIRQLMGPDERAKRTEIGGNSFRGKRRRAAVA